MLRNETRSFFMNRTAKEVFVFILSKVKAIPLQIHSAMKLTLNVVV